MAGVIFLFCSEGLEAPFLTFIESGEETGGGGAVDVTPAQVFVFGGVAEVSIRSVSLSARKMSLKFMICRPVEASSRTQG